MDNLSDIGPLQLDLAGRDGGINVLLLASENLLIEALYLMLARSGAFDSVVRSNSYESLNSSALAGIARLTVCVLIDNSKDVDHLRFCTPLLTSGVRIIAICSADLEVGVLKKAIKVGVQSLICVTSSLPELIVGITRTALGEKVLSKQVEQALVEDVFNESGGSNDLTSREQQVLEMVCGGQTIKEIAHTLKLSPHTIQFHHRSVMEKIGVNRTADLIVYAMRYGLCGG